MDIKEFITHLESAIESLEEDISYDGPYTDSLLVFDDGVVEILFGDGQRFRMTIEKLV